MAQTITWADRYREAAQRCLALQDTETNDLVRSALGEAAAKYTMAMLEHLEIEANARNELRRAVQLTPSIWAEPMYPEATDPA